MNAAVSKTVSGVKPLTGVRIPPLPCLLCLGTSWGKVSRRLAGLAVCRAGWGRLRLMLSVNRIDQSIGKYATGCPVGWVAGYFVIVGVDGCVWV